MDTDNYWVVRMEGEEKEADTRTIRQWIKEGIVSLNAKVRKATEDDWKPVSQVEEFSELFEKAPGAGEEEGFSIKKALNFGWTTTIKNLGFFIPLVLLMAVFMFFDALVLERINQPFLIIVSYLVYYAVYFIFQLGVVKVTLLFCDREKPAFGQLFSQHHLLIRYFLASILYFLIVFGGFILLIVPGVIWSIKFFFYDFLIVDKNAGIIDSLKKSDRITKGFKWELLGFGFVAIAINLLGLVALGIGLFVSVPVTILATAYIYRRLEKKLSIEIPDEAGEKIVSAEV